MQLSRSAPASDQPDGKADHKADQQRDSENSYDALIPPMAAHTTDTTPFDIPNAITHTLLLPQNSALAGVGRSTITSAVVVPNLKLKAGTIMRDEALLVAKRSRV